MIFEAISSEEEGA